MKEAYYDRVVEALSDDLNTPRALSIMHEIVSAMERENIPKKKECLRDELKKSMGLLGFHTSPEEWFKGVVKISNEEIEQQILLRLRAKEIKAWKEADAIRDYLLANGVELLDSKGGTRWRPVGIKNIK